MAKLEEDKVEQRFSELEKRFDGLVTSLNTEKRALEDENAKLRQELEGLKAQPTVAIPYGDSPDPLAGEVELLDAPALFSSRFPGQSVYFDRGVDKGRQRPVLVISFQAGQYETRDPRIVKFLLEHPAMAAGEITCVGHGLSKDETARIKAASTAFATAGPAPAPAPTPQTGYHEGAITSAHGDRVVR